MRNIQIVAPDGSRPSFTWSTVDCERYRICRGGDLRGTSRDQPCLVSATDAVSPTTGTFDCLDVSRGQFNARSVELLIDLPENYTCGDDCWWHVRYEPGWGTVTDRTTWSVSMSGDSVRLIE